MTEGPKQDFNKIIAEYLARLDKPQGGELLFPTPDDYKNFLRNDYAPDLDPAKIKHPTRKATLQFILKNHGATLEFTDTGVRHEQSAKDPSPRKVIVSEFKLAADNDSRILLSTADRTNAHLMLLAGNVFDSATAQNLRAELGNASADIQSKRDILKGQGINLPRPFKMPEPK